MDDLVGFLKARLDEDEQAAREQDGTMPYAHQTGPMSARYSPERVLAEVDAKRRILDRAEFVAAHGPAVDHVRALDMTTGASAALRDALRLLALPYAQHPDYRQEWAP